VNSRGRRSGSARRATARSLSIRRRPPPRDRAACRSDEANRTAHYRRKAEFYAAAQHEGTLADGIAPDRLALTLIALSAWRFCVPQLAYMLTGADLDDSAGRARRRATVAEIARRLAAPKAEK
jgi:tetracycline repressor-like protein